VIGLLDRSTQELRLVWRQLHRAGPPVGLSRDLLIRALAYDLQERTHGGASAALRQQRRQRVFINVPYGLTTFVELRISP
jgi:hypothetical protein